MLVVFVCHVRMFIMSLKNKNYFKEREFYCLWEGFLFFKIWLKLHNLFFFLSIEDSDLLSGMEIN